MEPAAKSDLATIWRLLSHARPYWGHIGVLLVLSLLSTPIALLAPIPLNNSTAQTVKTTFKTFTLRAVVHIRSP